jgi:hypothetical protein
MVVTSFESNVVQMPTTINVMSWNIESMGEAKVLASKVPKRDTELINFASLAIQHAAADVVGIMEIKGGIGKKILKRMCVNLNNSRPLNHQYEWQGRLSSRQDGGTQEEYLYLWKNQQNVLSLDMAGVPGPTSLPGVADWNAIEGFCQPKNWGKDVGLQLLTALRRSGYVQPGRFKQKQSLCFTKTLRVDPDSWNQINLAGINATVTFAQHSNPPQGLTTADKKNLASLLKNIDILRFVTYADRSPYLANFLVGNPAKRLMISLLHAPGPQDLTRLDAINVMALSLPMRSQVTQDNLLLMGDFNIAAEDAAKNGEVYARFIGQNNQFTFGKVSPIQRAQVFAPITGAPLNAPDLLTGVKTSLINAYIKDNSAEADTLANTYDKFFFKQSGPGQRRITQANAAARNLVKTVASNQGANFVPNIGVSALIFFRAIRGTAWLTTQESELKKKKIDKQKRVDSLSTRLTTINKQIQNASTVPGKNSALITRKNSTLKDLITARGLLKAVEDNLANIGVVMALVNNPVQRTATGIGTGLTVYRFAVSDHLPITVQLTA